MDKKIAVCLIALLALIFIFRTINPHLNPLTHVNVHKDEARVLIIARNVAERGQFAFSEGLSEYGLSLANAFWTGPLTVYAYAAFFYPFGSTYLVARLTAALFGFICIFLLFLITRDIYGKKSALMCLVLAGLNPVFAFYSRVALHDMLSYMFFLAAVYLALNIERRTRIRMALIGLCAGLASIARYNGIIILLAVIIYFAYTRRGRVFKDLLYLMVPCLLVFLGFYYWLVSNGFLDAFLTVFLNDIFVSGIAAKTGVVASFGPLAALQVILKYLPFLLVSTVAGLLVIYKRGFAGRKEKLILIWMIVGFAWWIQSFGSGKYTMVFTFPMFVFVSGAFMKIIRNPIFRLDRRHVTVFLAAMLSFYVAVNMEAVYDIRDDSVYRASEVIKASGERVLFAETPLAFVSGKSLFPYYWNDSVTYYWDESFRAGTDPRYRFELFYPMPNNQSVYDYIERTRPRYIMLSSDFALKGATPRREFHHYIDLYGSVRENIGTYVLYELAWPG